MTGRDLIIYILENGLENEPIVDDSGKLIGFKTMSEVANEMGVGTETVKAWIMMKKIPFIDMCGKILIPANYKSPINKPMVRSNK